MKKFMKKLLKKAEGFTLVELIVVIAILGILAGVAVPAYSGYLKKANDAAVVTQLDAIQTAATAANAKAGAISKVEVTSSTTATVYAEKFSDTFAADFALYYTAGTSAAPTVVENKDDTAALTLTAITNWDNSSYTGKTAIWTSAGWSIS